jgi:hypothetical protein
MTKIDNSRFLVLDVRAGRIGFAAFSFPKELLDFGSPRFDSSRSAKLRVASLLRAFAPSLLVLRRIRRSSTRGSREWNLVVRAIRDQAKRSSIPVHWVPERALKEFFNRLGCRNKFEVANLLAKWFPEIARKLPRKRKPYEPEPWTLAYFDTISLGIAFLERMALTESQTVPN